jgi:hypothetical protein
VSDDESISRQRQRDAEYLRACREHGIEAEPPRYVSALPSASDEAIDAALNDGAGGKNGKAYRTRGHEPQPLDPMKPEAVAALKLLDVLIPVKADIKAFVQTAGRRVLVLSWMLGRRPEPLAEMARQLGISRASLSTYARELEDRTGLHSRGQKCSGSRSVYRDNAKRSWKLRRLNSMMKQATATEGETPASAQA